MFDVGLNEMAKMRVIFEPLIVFLIRETLVPAIQTKNKNKNKKA